MQPLEPGPLEPGPLEPWIERQYRYAAEQMLASVSPLGIVKTRPGFGQQIRPLRGSIVASPVLGAYDPDPDYFFHWYRDSAVIVEALRLLAEAAPAGQTRAELHGHFADFVRFSVSLRSLDGRSLLAAPAWRAGVTAQFTRYVRTDAELAAVHGESVAGETRVNPDGTLDISQWARPQHDGPALRALALLRWAALGGFDEELGAAVAELLRADLAYTRRHAQEACFDIWEEELGLHYYTQRVAAAALEQGAQWLEHGARHGVQHSVQHHGDPREAQACRAQAQALRSQLDGYWLADEGYYRSRLLSSGARSAKELDIAVILAVLHAGGGSEDSNDRSSRGDAHGVHDPRMHATLSRLEAQFDAEYAINRGRPAARAPALGRYRADRYYSGGAYYFSTLAAAEFHYARAAAAGGADAGALLERGDAFLRTVQAYTPASGELSEQFDQRTGAQTSAKHLAWSYAAFISCISARRAATGQR